MGPMFSGKSTELLRRIRRYSYAKQKCLMIKFKHDNRYSEDCMSTHDRQMMAAVPCSELSEIGDLYKEYDVIGIDEGQFYPDLNSFCDQAADDGKVVIIASLDGDFMRKPFGTICNLIPLAESVTKLSAVCTYCCGDAAFTERIGTETEQQLIGGSEKYLPVCRKCFHSPHDDLQSGVDLEVAPATPNQRKTKIKSASPNPASPTLSEEESESKRE